MSIAIALDGPAGAGKSSIAKVEKYIKIQPITFALFLASAVLIFAF